ncbi:MAG: glutamate-1-semialdehyde 2,1-aminomutase [Saprospiraceae bacterium]|nr:glutamate-1-semialdehyde 2,1-aminomutase [Saprospiraceae bacterium]
MSINRDTSAHLFEIAKKYFPGGVNSPVRAFRSVEGTPLFIKKGRGSHIWDEDDNEFIDFLWVMGPLILGHANPNVIQAITETIQSGTSFGAPTRLENELASLIVDNHPVLEKIRFVSSGTEAVMSALRLARGATGRNKIIKFEGCYHGHVDSLLVKAGSGLVTFGISTSAGIPESFAAETIVLPLNEPFALEAVLQQYENQIAAIIIEPIPANNGLLVQNKSFLQYLRTKCDEYGCVLIFDEVISGFRAGFGGAAEKYEVRPDIITFGKIVGGGLPVGAYGGSAEIMSYISPDGPVYQAGTLSGNPVAMSAGIATLTQLLQPGFYESLEDKTIQFCSEISAHIQSKQYPVHLVQIDSIFWIAFSTDRIFQAEQIDPDSMKYFKQLHRHLLDNGVYFGPSGYEVGFVSAAHTSGDLEKAAQIISEGLDFIFNV